MRMEMLLSFSRIRRSFSWRPPTISPSRPTKGLVDASKTTAMVGSSTAMGAISVTGLSGSVMMSPMSASSMPMTATISPASAAVTSALPRFSKVYTLRICARRSAPSGFTTSTCSFSCSVPEDKRPTPMRPS